MPANIYSSTVYMWLSIYNAFSCWNQLRPLQLNNSDEGKFVADFFHTLGKKIRKKSDRGPRQANRKKTQWGEKKM